MKIAIFGLGYVGTTAAACLASQGHQVLGVDPSRVKVDTINAGRSPIVEPRVEEMIREAVDRKLLSATAAATAELNSCSIAIVCVGTPSQPGGQLDRSYLASATAQIAEVVDPKRTEPLTVIYRSTTEPGTMEAVILPIFREKLGDRADSVIEVVYNPEFLREAVAVEDYFNPPKIVIGTRNGEPCRNLEEMNHGIKAPTFYTKYREAEITKFVDNTFHALKVTFANEIGRVCGRLSIDARKVHEIFVSDTKLNISPAYLRPGAPFGGSCLPKDVRGLQSIGSTTRAETHLINSLTVSNQAHKEFILEMCLKGLKPQAKVLLIGLAFKAHSDDLRESPYIELAIGILIHGHSLQILDPSVHPEALVGKNLNFVHSTLSRLSELLVEQSTAEATQYDLVIDTRGWSSKLSLTAARTVNVNTLAAHDGEKA